MKRAGLLVAAALVGILPFTGTSSEAACCRGAKPMMKKSMGMKAHGMRGHWVAYRGRWSRAGWRYGGWRRGGALRIVSGGIPASPPPYYYSQWSRVAGVLVPRPVEVGPGVAPAPRLFFGLF